MSKQGNALLRYLWCEAAMHAVRHDVELKRFYRRKLVQKGLGKARVAGCQETRDPLVDHAARSN
jgi:transposase